MASQEYTNVVDFDSSKMMFSRMTYNKHIVLFSKYALPRRNFVRNS